MNSIIRYWIVLLLGLGLIFSPFILGYWVHINDVRLAMLSGTLIGSAALWNLGDDQIRLLPVLTIYTSGWILVVTALVFNFLGDGHVLISLLPVGVLQISFTRRDLGQLLTEKKREIQ